MTWRSDGSVTRTGWKLCPQAGPAPGPSPGPAPGPSPGPSPGPAPASTCESWCLNSEGNIRNVIDCDLHSDMCGGCPRCPSWAEWHMSAVPGLCVWRNDTVCNSAYSTTFCNKPLGQPVSDWNADGIIDVQDCKYAALADSACQGGAISFNAFNNNQCYCDVVACTTP